MYHKSPRLTIVAQKMALITCQVKTGGATGDTDESLITERGNHPIGCFARLVELHIKWILTIISV